MNDREFFDSLPAYIEEGLKKWEVPSLSVGVIKDGKPVFCRGFGYRDWENKLPADEKTIYMIGSSSKAFTATIAAVLVDKGLLDWDTPIVNYVPEIAFYNSEMTSGITMRDLLCHRIGLPRHEYSWFFVDYNREEMCMNLRYLEPNKPMRHTFQYCNQAFILAGYIEEKLTGKTWEELLKEYIFEPLGMTRTTAFHEDMVEDENHAEPYGRAAFNTSMHGIHKIPYYLTKVEDRSKGIGAPYGPAGSICSCAEDMMKWVQFHLQNGQWEGKQLISEKNMKELHKSNMIAANQFGGQPGCNEFCEYAMGWFVAGFLGHTLIHHGGVIDGFCAETSFFPEYNVGIVAYSNMYINNFHAALCRHIAAHYAGDESHDFSDEYYKLAEKSIETAAGFAKTLTGEQIKGTKPSRELSEYCGTYEKKGYEPVTVSCENGQLFIFINQVKVALKHFHYDTFVSDGVIHELPSDVPFTFIAETANGQIDVVSVPLNTEEGAEMTKFRRVE